MAENTVLVTGGAGFIGSSVIPELLKRGERVVCIDNFDNYYSPAIKRENIRPFMHDKNFSLVEVDIRNKNSIEHVFGKHKIKKVLHLAARAGVRSSIENPGLYEDVNIRGTLNMLELSAGHGIENFTFASSSSIYGASKNVPFNEDDGGAPISPYGITKRAGELYCRYYTEAAGMDCACLRYFTAYGPKQRPEMAIHKFTRLIDECKELPMYGDGGTARDYTYIDDIVQGTLAALELKGKGFEIINLGNSGTVRLAELIGLIENELGKKAKIKRMPEQQGDVPLTHANISKARRLLGYSPKTRIEEGVKKFVFWYKSGRRNNG